MAQKLDLKIKGLYTNPNEFSEVPAGALKVADNIVIDKESIAESRRGQKAYGNQLSISTGEINKIFNYRNSLVTHYEDKLAYDSDNAGTWTAYSGTYNAPENDFKMRSLEANRNFYFTTSQGIFKLDSITSTPRAAGAPKGLDGYGSTTGSSGFMADDTAVAYRIVWGYRDKNNNLVLGAPSQRVVIANSSGGTRDVSITFTIPAGITTSYIYQIYRSGASASATTEPNDELQLVIEDSPTSGQITAKTMTLTDATPDDLRGAFLYTSPSQEGIANANEVPPYAKDMDVFKDHTFYANVRSKQRYIFTIISVDSPSFGHITDASCDTTDTDETLTVSDSSDMRVGMRIIGTGIPADTYIASITNGTTIEMTQAATVTDTGVSIEFQDRITIDQIDYWAGTSTSVSDNQFQVYTAGTPAENIDNSALELVEVVNKVTANTSVYAYYLSGYNDLPGQILLEERLLGGDMFELSSTYGASFSPVLPERNEITAISQADPTVITSASHGLTTGDEIEIYGSNSTPSIDGTHEVTVTDANNFTIDIDVTSAGTVGYWNTTDNFQGSDNDERQNRIYISKAKQPEAVPLYSYLDVGSADAPIRRIVALRDSVFVFKDDGIFRITGEDVTTFRVSLFDNTAVIKAPETARAFNNQVFTFSDQGIIAVSDNGVAVQSRAIESTLLELSSDLYANFEDATFAVSYESNRQYILFTVTQTTDTYATQAFVYNSFTNSWTRWVMDRTCGAVSKRDNKLYMGHPTNDFIYQERKDFALSDYADEEYAVSITSSSGTTVVLSDTSLIVAGMTLKQGTRESVVVSVDTSNDITVSQSLAWEAGAAKVFEPIDTNVEFVKIDIENPGITKQFRETTLLFRDASFNSLTLGFTSNFSATVSSTTVSPQATRSWGSFPWGEGEWGGSLGGAQPIRTFIPLEKQRAHWISMSIAGSQAFTSFSLAGVSIMFNAVSERFKD